MTTQVTAPNETRPDDSLDQHWMERALRLSRRAMGRVAPNPAVGAVIVRNGEVVGEGYTEPPGWRHAEIVALDRAGELAQGATMYVTLEPCSHYGRTPPCRDAILEAGIARVVTAVKDPNPLVNGQSIRAFTERGIGVTVGTGAEEAIRINAGFFKRILTGLPEVHVKYAMSLDGKIATHTGHARWITGPEARREAHMIRDVSDAILVGIGTVMADNPMLTTRLPDEDVGSGGPHHPMRVIADSQARMPVDAAMLAHGVASTTLVAVSESAPVERIRRLRETGADVIVVPLSDGRINLSALLAMLGEWGMNTLMVEGGAEVIGSLADDGLIDRVTAFIAPVLLGGDGAPSPIGGAGVEHADQAVRLVSPEYRPVGADIRVSGYVAGKEPGERQVTCSPES